MSDFNREFQISLIVNLSHNKDLLEYAMTRLEINDFDLPACKLVFEVLHAYFKIAHTHPPFTTLMLEVGKRIEQPEVSEVQLLPEEIDSLSVVCQRIQEQGGLDPAYFKATLPEYIKSVRTSDLLLRHSRGSIDSPSIVDEMAKLKDVTSSATKSPVMVSGSSDIRPVLTPDDLVKVSLGTSTLNARVAGGLRTKGLGMITAAPGVGKTNSLINFAFGAVRQGLRVLFITLELERSRIQHRYSAMSACIQAGLFEIPRDQWDPVDLAAYQYIISPNYMFYDYLTIMDMSDSSAYTLSDIDRAIEKWKEAIRKKYGDEEADKCKAVYMDWLDRLEPEGRMIYQKKFEYLPKMLEEIGNLAKRYDTANWTATQATSAADGAEEVRMKHTSFGFHKNDPLDIGIGVSPVEALKLEGDQDLGVSMRVSGVNAYTTPSCSNTLNYYVNKNRDAPQGGVNLYMSPALRLFNSQKEWTNIRNNVKKGNFVVLGGTRT